MKKAIAVFLLLFMIGSLWACGKGNSDLDDTADESANDEITVDGTTEETTEADSEGVEYVVTVVDTENNPITGAVVQMCKLGDDGSCTPGNPSDTDGKVMFSLTEDDYKVSFIVMPAGYTYVGEDQDFYFEEDSTELTITLKKAD